MAPALKRWIAPIYAVVSVNFNFPYVFAFQLTLAHLYVAEASIRPEQAVVMVIVLDCEDIFQVTNWQDLMSLVVKDITMDARVIGKQKEFLPT